MSSLSGHRQDWTAETQSVRRESGCRCMSSDQGLSIFDDEPESGDDAGEETQVLPVTPKEQPAAKAAARPPRSPRRRRPRRRSPTPSRRPRSSRSPKSSPSPSRDRARAPSPSRSPSTPSPRSRPSTTSPRSARPSSRPTGRPDPPPRPRRPAPPPARPPGPSPRPPHRCPVVRRGGYDKTAVDQRVGQLQTEKSGLATSLASSEQRVIELEARARPDAHRAGGEHEPDLRRPRRARDVDAQARRGRGR